MTRRLPQVRCVHDDQVCGSETLDLAGEVLRDGVADKDGDVRPASCPGRQEPGYFLCRQEPGCIVPAQRGTDGQEGYALGMLKAP